MAWTKAIDQKSRSAKILQVFKYKKSIYSCRQVNINITFLKQ